MKFIKIYILMIVLLLNVLFAFSQDSIIKNQVLKEKIIKTDYKPFIEKTVSAFISSENIKDYYGYYYVDYKPFVLNGVRLEISNNIEVEIIVNKYVFLNRFNVERKWDFDLFKKENISAIKFISNEEVFLKIE